MRNFPIDSHYKNRQHLSRHRHDVLRVGDFYIGVYGENVCLLSDKAGILFLVIQKKTHIMIVSARNNK